MLHAVALKWSYWVLLVFLFLIQTHTNISIEAFCVVVESEVYNERLVPISLPVQPCAVWSRWQTSESQRFFTFWQSSIAQDNHLYTDGFPSRLDFSHVKARGSRCQATDSVFRPMSWSRRLKAGHIGTKTKKQTTHWTKAASNRDIIYIIHDLMNQVGGFRTWFDRQSLFGMMSPKNPWFLEVRKCLCDGTQVIC